LIVTEGGGSKIHAPDAVREKMPPFTAVNAAPGAVNYNPSAL